MLFGVLLFVAGPLLASSDPAADSVVVVLNGNDPDSLAIGRYYAERRGIPEANLVSLDAPLEETITLREYVDRIHNPLLDALLERDWITGVKQPEPDRYGRNRLLAVVHRVSYLVTIRGIPLRFHDDAELLASASEKIPKSMRHNRASVDSELALMAAPADLSMAAFVANPYFDKPSASEADAHRVIRVCRLDGPERRDVIRLIDRSLEAEAEGLMGRAYVDSGGPHKNGNSWFEAVRDLAEAAHFDTDFEGSRKTFNFSDRLDAPAIYMGWYRQNAYGPWERPRWSVPPGAIGFHLHSFSGTTVRSASRGWLGPLIRQGYAATFGNVFEPYLEYTHRPQIVLEQLLRGARFGDAVNRANPVLSWQTVAIGDPLYRPFRVGLDAQLAHARDLKFGAYAVIREVNRLVAADKPDTALREARARFKEAPSLPLALRLSELLEASGEPGKAEKILQPIRYINRFSLEEVVLGQKIADRLHGVGASAFAVDLYEKLLEGDRLPRSLRLTLLEQGAAVATESMQRGLAAQWRAEAQRLHEAK